MQAAISEPASLGGEVAEPCSKRGVVRPSRSVAHRAPIGTDDLARPPLAHLVGLGEMSDGFPLDDGRHHFLESSSSARRCRAWRRRAAASAWRSRPRAPSPAWPPTRPCRRTWPVLSVERRRADPVLAAHVGGRNPHLLLAQNGNDLLLRKPRSLHRPILPSGLLPENWTVRG